MSLRRAHADRPAPRSRPVVLVISGDVELSVIARLARLIHRACASGCDVVVDLARCDFLDPEAMPVLLEADRHLRGRGRQLILVSRDGSALREQLGPCGDPLITYPTYELAEIAVQLITGIA